MPSLLCRFESLRYLQILLLKYVIWSNYNHWKRYAHRIHLALMNFVISVQEVFVHLFLKILKFLLRTELSVLRAYFHCYDKEIDPHDAVVHPLAHEASPIFERLSFVAVYAGANLQERHFKIFEILFTLHFISRNK